MVAKIPKLQKQSHLSLLRQATFLSVMRVGKPLGVEAVEANVRFIFFFYLCLVSMEVWCPFSDFQSNPDPKRTDHKKKQNLRLLGV